MDKLLLREDVPPFSVPADSVLEELLNSLSSSHTWLRQNRQALKETFRSIGFAIFVLAIVLPMTHFDVLRGSLLLLLDMLTFYARKYFQNRDTFSFTEEERRIKSLDERSTHFMNRVVKQTLRWHAQYWRAIFLAVDFGVFALTAAILVLRVIDVVPWQRAYVGFIAYWLVRIVSLVSIRHFLQVRTSS